MRIASRNYQENDNGWANEVRKIKDKEGEE